MEDDTDLEDDEFHERSKKISKDLNVSKRTGSSKKFSDLHVSKRPVEDDNESATIPVPPTSDTVCVQSTHSLEGKQKWDKRHACNLPAESDDESVVIPMSSTSDALHVQTTHSFEGKQKWDKRHACKYCENLYPKIAMHLETVHSDEEDVARALALPKHSGERKDAWAQIRNEGNWEHNFEVLKSGKGTLIPKYREKEDGKPISNYIPCTGCKALFSKKSLHEHRRLCKANSSNKRGQGGKEGKMLLPLPKNVGESFYKRVILSMVNDDVFSVVTSDSLIMDFGKRLFDNKDIQEHTPNHINVRMREFGRLVLGTRKLPSPIFSWEDCLNPLNFYTIVSCVKSLAGFNEDTHFYTTPSLALKVGYSLQRCAKILESNGITEKNQSKKENGENVLKLYSSNWNDLISSRARQTQEEKKYIAPKMLPLSQDVYMLTGFLKSKMRTMRQHLVDDISIYFELLKVTLCLVTLFNRKCGGDVQRITVATYKHALKMQNSLLFDNEVRSSFYT
ncbi:uncharacterized protein LOC132555368 [Ylistrum balloti]|uniref:uncharacterized protein LOC132555368 n=1 Tax=Ylistrum balloti TaxID=509963 RepID=UPI002905E11C|nr:uncharacterized protein LOC132555368 [Ylistrum balloti]